LYERAVPLFVDVDPLTGNIDAALVRAATGDIMRGGASSRQWLPRTLRDRAGASALKAILPVHAFGQPADMTSIMDIARRSGLRVVEDACEALGAGHHGQRVGSFGDLSCFAFYPNKQMTTGEGGMIVTDDEQYANLCSSLRNQGRDVFDAWLSHSRLGFNYRLNELSCALGIVQLTRIDDMLAKRAQVAAWYSERLRGIDGVHAPEVTAATTRMSWFVYVIRLDSTTLRTATMDALAARGIPSRPYFTPIHLQPFYVEKFGYRRGDFPVAEALGDTSLALPFSSVMTEDQVDCVCDALTAVLSEQTVRR
jgi:dTDP-4-amino-4,6-dideoxygalactose transaminase